MTIKIYRAGLMAFINSVCIWHFDFKTVLHGKLFYFSNKKITKEVFRQKPIHLHAAIGFLDMLHSIVVLLLRLQHDFVRFGIVKMHFEILTKLLIINHK